MILKNLIFCVVLFNFKQVICDDQESELEIPDGDVELKVPIAININNQKSTSQCDFTESADHKKVTFDPKQEYAIQTVNSLASKLKGGSDQQIWSAETPSQRAFKVIGYDMGKDGKKVEIYCYDGTLLTYFRETSSDKYVDESEIGNAKKNRKARFAYTKVLLYILTTVLGFLLLLVLGIGIPSIIRRKRQDSEAVLRPDYMV